MKVVMRVLTRWLEMKCWIVIGLLAVVTADPVTAQSVEEDGLTWHGFNEGVEEARESGRPVFVYVYAPWCGWCHKMDEEVFGDPKLAAYLAAHFELVRLNYDERDTVYRYKQQEISRRRLMDRLHVAGVPTVVILDSRGNYLLHVPGFVEARRLLSIVR